MAAAEVSLDNVDQGFEDMKAAFNEWTRRETGKKKEDTGAKESVRACAPGEWILLTVDFSPKVKVDRAHWVYTPMNPGSPNPGQNDDEDFVKASIEEGLYAMKCLMRGFNPIGHTSADGFENLERFEYIKEGKGKGGKGPVKGKGVNSVLVVSVEDQIMGISCNDINKITPKQRVQWARCKDAMSAQLGVKAKCVKMFDSEDDFNADEVYKQAAALKISV